MKQIYLYLLSLLHAVAVSAYDPPAMGWSSWNTYRVHISEELIKKQAEAMHRRGLDKVGYRYVNIDDGYFGGRAANGRLLIHATRFPNGLKPVVDYIHSLGLKAGIYSDAGINTCGSFWDADTIGRGVGMYGHDCQDADFFFKELGFDFIKVDFCGGDARQNVQQIALNPKDRYTAIRKAIGQAGRKGVRMNVCRWAFPGTWVHDVADSWRIDADIDLSWQAVKRIIRKNLYLSSYATEGKFNDMDMMEVGRGLTEEEDKTHFGMWCIMSSPLMIGCDITSIDDKTLALISNKELIALNQDTLALQAEVIEKQGEAFILAKDIENPFGKVRALAVYNPGETEQIVTVDMERIGLSGMVRVRDLYLCRNLPDLAQTTFKVTLPPHGTRIYRLEADKRLERVRYEAEHAWLDGYSAIDESDFSWVTEEDSCSAGAKVQAAKMTWKSVYSKHGGTYRLRMAYVGNRAGCVSVSVNREREQRWVLPPANGVASVIEMPQTIQLRPGVNCIQILHAESEVPHVDYIELLPV